MKLLTKVEGRTKKWPRHENYFNKDKMKLPDESYFDYKVKRNHFSFCPSKEIFYKSFRV